ncbi:MAG TPA: 3-deoxy-7-phosphoheptulonate synthase, partial [Gammaproteobacteria bacterium]|nr:3-deoxy-7-phosphoheptulonate synthase [Gammaproteobacteria bacterium]
MIIILKPDADKTSNEYKSLQTYLDNLNDITIRMHEEIGEQQRLTELYLVGNTAALDISQINNFSVVERAVRVSREYRVLGRHSEDVRDSHFDYNGVRFGQDEFNIFAGLCAVDTREHVEEMMRAIKDLGLNCTRMGAYKPRTNPYSFQGFGKKCLPYVFELAGKY